MRVPTGALLLCDRGHTCGRARAQPVIEDRAEIDPVVERAAVPRTFDEMGRVARPEQRDKLVSLEHARELQPSKGLQEF